MFLCMLCEPLVPAGGGISEAILVYASLSRTVKKFVQQMAVADYKALPGSLGKLFEFFFFLFERQNLHNPVCILEL